MSLIFIMINFMQSPISLCFVILLQILFCSADLSLNKSHIWVVFIFLLIFFGGIMVIFMYVRSVSQNDQLVINIKWLSLIPLRVVFLCFDKFRLNKTETCPITCIFRPYRLNWGVFLLIYLLITIVLVVKLTRPNYGALRSGLN